MHESRDDTWVTTHFLFMEEIYLRKGISVHFVRTNKRGVWSVKEDINTWPNCGNKESLHGQHLVTVSNCPILGSNAVTSPLCPLAMSSRGCLFCVLRWVAVTTFLGLSVSMISEPLFFPLNGSRPLTPLVVPFFFFGGQVVHAFLIGRKRDIGEVGDV